MAEDSRDGANALDTGTPGGGAAATPEDPVKNLKSEYGRKFEGVTSQLQQLSQQLQELASQRNQPAPAIRQQTSIRDRIYDDPDGVINEAVSRAKSEALQEAESLLNNRQNMQNAVYRMTSEYPELAQSENQALVQRIHNSLPASIRNTPEGAELALSRAAAEQGLIPASRRRKPAGADDSYIPPSSGSPRRDQPKEGKLNDEQLTFVHLLNQSIGRPVDEKVLKNATKYAGRKTWTKFSGGEES